MNQEFNHRSTKKILNEVTVAEIMSAPVKTVVVGAPFSEVEEMFLDCRIRHLPIVNHFQELVGIITQKDLYRLISPRKVIEKTLEYDGDTILDGNAYYSKKVLNSYILKHVMTKNVCTLGLKNTVGEAIHAIVSNQISSVIIVDDSQKVLGIITTFDIMNLADKIFLDSNNVRG